MKTTVLFLLLFTTAGLPGQTYTLSVMHGYGSGEFEAGDTVHVWATAFYGRSYFDRWIGDTLSMNDPLDWHTRLVMPAHDLSVEAIIGELPPDAGYMTDEIQGADTLKKVWLGFPGQDTPNGLVWLFHGTNGSGENWFTNNDMTLCIKKLMSEGYAVISLDCEEKTRNLDFNSDGVFRWDYDFDSLQNIDVRNVKAIRDTLIHRGWIGPDTKQIGYGYSAGGAFTTHIATQLGWHAGITHNASGLSWVPDFGLTPLLYSMTGHDDHPEVGPQATIEAQAYVATLQSRQVCAAFRLALSQPLYPERFNRSPGISLSLSAAIFDELKNNNVLDAENALLYKSSEILPLIFQEPANWPVLTSLSPADQVFVSDEIDETYANHRFNSDLFGSDLRFIQSLCDEISSVTTISLEPLHLYPNPANERIMLPYSEEEVIVYDLQGKEVWHGTSGFIEVGTWENGVYVLVCGNKVGRFVKI